ncbi:MAG: 4-hydroxy-tetrahydrodipicolinate reductase [Bacteroidales bacterium]
MKIALLGYGKMGKEIQKLAETRNHQISCIIDNDDDWSNKYEDFCDCDVAIEFSTPESAIKNIRRCFKDKVPIAIGTTGWHKEYDSIKGECEKEKACMLFASNFSIGMNIFFEINKKLSKLLSNYNEYNASIEETHHIQKLDAPSGTAITIAEQIISNSSTYNQWKLKEDYKSDEKDNTLEIESKRIGQVPGTHTVNWDSSIDSIQIKHEAKNRKGLALGAILAAEFIKDKTGVFSIQDLLF